MRMKSPGFTCPVAPRCASGKTMMRSIARFRCSAPYRRSVPSCRRYCFTAAVKQYLLQEGTDLRYGALHLKRAIERIIVFPLAHLGATGQVKPGDFIRIDIDAKGKMTFVKEAEGALVPVLLERYGPDASA